MTFQTAKSALLGFCVGAALTYALILWLVRYVQ